MRLSVLAALAALSVWALALFLGHGTALAQQPLLLCTTDAPPLSLPDGSGMLDAIVQEAFRRAGQPVSLVITPSERGLINANTGVADGDINRIAGLAKSYPNLVQVAEPNMSYEFVAFAKRPLALAGWDSLKSYKVGYITGWKILEENVRAANVTRVDTPRQLFALLAQDRVDLVLYERWTGEHLLRELQLADARVLDPPLARRDMFLYLNARHAALAPRVAAALKAMKADGTYAAIVARFRRR